MLQPRRKPASCHRRKGKNVGILQSRTDNTRRIALEGAADIGSARELQAALDEALGAGETVSVALAGITDADITTWQLLWAAQREAGRRGVQLAFEGPLPEPLREQLAGLGLNAPGLAERKG